MWRGPQQFVALQRGRDVSEDVKPNIMPIVVGWGLAISIAVAVLLSLPEVATVETDVVLPVQAREDLDDAGPAIEALTEDAPVAKAPVVEPPIPEVVADAPDVPAAAEGPQFDTFRVEPDGSMVVAGRAAPGQTVDIILAGVAIDRVTADAGGNFVALPIAGPSDAPRRLSLVADPDGLALASATSYLVAPIAAPVVASDQTAQEETMAGLAAPAEPDTEMTAGTAPAPPTVLQADADGVRVLQGGPALGRFPDEENVALDAITYDPEGEVQLSGRATGDGSVQIYLDNEPLTASPVTEGGDWRVNLPQIDTGVYTLRIDEVDAEGDVVSRLETPFKREEPQDVVAVLAEETDVEGFEVAVRTVQPGSTLWAIAEESLGAGILYVEVFEANTDLIRDPDLIYPGQIFRVPNLDQ